jgi:hypothetical protein
MKEPEKGALGGLSSWIFTHVGSRKADCEASADAELIWKHWQLSSGLVTIFRNERANERLSLRVLAQTVYAQAARRSREGSADGVDYFTPVSSWQDWGAGAESRCQIGTSHFEQAASASATEPTTMSRNACSPAICPIFRICPSTKSLAKSCSPVLTASAIISD